LSIKEEALLSESDNNNKSNKIIEPVNPPASLSLNGRSEDHLKLKGKNVNASASAIISDLKDGSSDSDSSAILNDDHSPNASNSSSGLGQNHQILISSNSSSFRFNCSSSSSPSSLNCFALSDSRSDGLGTGNAPQNNDNVYHPQFVKMEEHNFFGGDEACNFFSDEQAPTLHWYCADGPDQWN